MILPRRLFATWTAADGALVWTGAAGAAVAPPPPPPPQPAARAVSGITAAPARMGMDLRRVMLAPLVGSTDARPRRAHCRRPGSDSSSCPTRGTATRRVHPQRQTGQTRPLAARCFRAIASTTTATSRTAPGSALTGERDGGRDQRAAVGRALDAEPAVERGEPVAEPPQTAAIRAGAPDAVVAHVDVQRAVLGVRRDSGARRMRVL